MCEQLFVTLKKQILHRIIAIIVILNIRVPLAKVIMGEVHSSCHGTTTMVQPATALGLTGSTIPKLWPQIL